MLISCLSGDGEAELEAAHRSDSLVGLDLLLDRLSPAPELERSRLGPLRSTSAVHRLSVDEGDSLALSLLSVLNNKVLLAAVENVAVLVLNEESERDLLSLANREVVLDEEAKLLADELL